MMSRFLDREVIPFEHETIASKRLENASTYHELERNVVFLQLFYQKRWVSEENSVWKRRFAILM